jgi:hypothetical protein
VTFDDRGHFSEPHTDLEFGIGTLSVREYLASTGAPQVLSAGVIPARVFTRGPHGRFAGVLFFEKEGWRPLIEHVRLAERYDLAVFSTKGMSVAAARRLVDHLCGELGLPLYVLHDFDKSGFSILGTLTGSGIKYRFKHKITPIDLGLRLDDVKRLNLESEPVRVGKEQSREKIRATLRRHRAADEEIAFMLGEDTIVAAPPGDDDETGAEDDEVDEYEDDEQRDGVTPAQQYFYGRRVELNALNSQALVEFVETKLQQAGVKKVMPDTDTLTRAFKTFVEGRELEVKFEEVRKTFAARTVVIPDDLEQQLRVKLEADPGLSWDEALYEIADAQ